MRSVRAAMNVVILHEAVPPGAREDELDVLVQADVVGRALSMLGHESVRLPLTLDLRAGWEVLERSRPDVVFNLVESLGGYVRLLTCASALLDALRIPYTGSRTEALFVTTDKVLTKRLLCSHGLPTPPWYAPNQPVPPPGRYIVKGAWEEASVGIDDTSIVDLRTPRDFAAAVADRGAALGGEAFAEAYIDGREFNLSLLARPEGGADVLPPAEIDFSAFPAGTPRIVGYAAKWEAASFEYQHTPRTFDFSPRDTPLLAELRRLAAACWDLFGLRGYARVDFRVDAAGQPWILEINANPGLAPDAGFPAAVARAGLTFEDMIARVLADALRP